MAEFYTKYEGVEFPKTKLLLRCRDSVKSFFGPPTISPPDAPLQLSLETCDYLTNSSLGLRLHPIFSPDGRYVCFATNAGNPLIIQDLEAGPIKCEIPCLDAQYVEFSPLGNFLITYSKQQKSASSESTAIGNLQIWSVDSASIVASFHQRAYKKDIIQWTADEVVCARIVTNEVHVMHNNQFDQILGKVHHKNISQFKLSPTLAQPFIAVFNPESGGKPGRVNIYRYDCQSVSPYECLDTSISRSMFNATEADMSFSRQGTSLLIHTHCDVDSSNGSYYGTMGLHLVSMDGTVSAIVPQSKDGHVHAAQWSPLGNAFVMLAGNMPCHCTLFNDRGEPQFEFGAAHRNTISYSPHGRFLCLAGFGNLAGEMDFYDILKLKRLGRSCSHCAVGYGWSPDSR